jgi:hypothetical protein
VRDDFLALLLEDEGPGARALELGAVLVVALEEQCLAGDEREEHAVAVEAPAAEHGPRRDRGERAQRLDHELDEFGGLRHGISMSENGERPWAGRRIMAPCYSMTISATAR